MHEWWGGVSGVNVSSEVWGDVAGVLHSPSRVHRLKEAAATRMYSDAGNRRLTSKNIMSLG